MLDLGELERELLALLMVELGIVIGEELVELRIAPMRRVPKRAGREFGDDGLCHRSARRPIRLAHRHHEPGLIVA